MDPASDVVTFVKEMMGSDIRIHHMPELGSWTVEARQLGLSAAGTSEWGTSRRDAGELLADALNSRVPQIFDVFKDVSGERRVLNVVDTEAARDKLQKIKQAFQTGFGPIPIAPIGWRGSITTGSTTLRPDGSTALTSNFPAPLAPSFFMGTRNAASGGSSPPARPILRMRSAPARR
ncbi:N-6 DNA methylase (plasmid) [Sinorhizobium fredii HH103]|uniref:N-6 DNA methylase n=1 Tax=Sinorhizobium fredii (strain HH103) TaxID=1117943 RepID=G9AC86_SINF1|nr:N-6 DNA methylase [Sinorhizobium fredii HH103]